MNIYSAWKIERAGKTLSVSPQRKGFVRQNGQLSLEPIKNRVHMKISLCFDFAGLGGCVTPASTGPLEELVTSDAMFVLGRCGDDRELSANFIGSMLVGFDGEGACLVPERLGRFPVALEPSRSVRATDSSPPEGGSMDPREQLRRGLA